MKPSLLMTLYKLAEMGASQREVRCTTTELARKLSLSQQTASRHLIALEQIGLIRRTKKTGGDAVQLTEKGYRQLNLMYLTLQGIFEPPKEILIEGEVFSGLGEGAYYMSQEGYRKQFNEKLGFDPCLGTLNLKIAKEYERERRLLETIPFILIEGFSNGKRSYGPVKCYRAIINNKIDGTVITAMRSHYGEDVLEIIAPGNLRENLKLNDGDIVQVRVLISTPQ